ncbi:MAG: hypothetical protein L0Y66_06615 [Myxococcaceae bacterium]|nr:hypothetical protein [Myxococcaceae bacterium]MCI0673213.1 hypothetical protein [Myxococcaceae bacterium]
MQQRQIVVLVCAVMLVGVAAYAQQSRSQRLERVEAHSADLVVPHGQRGLSLRAGVAAAFSMASTAGLTVDDVGDVDSFGRNLRWLGVTQMNVTLTSNCTGIEPGCEVLTPSPGVTTFKFEDLAHITLPPQAAHSLLCYWFSPILNVTYNNPTAAQVVAKLVYSPSLTVENPVLDDPTLIDPTTGAPFGGRLLTSMSSSERFEVPLAPGVRFTERMRDSNVCIAGFVSRRSLVETYGLTDVQAEEFFNKQTTVRMNITGSAQYVDHASMMFGFRIIGD